MAQPRRRLPGRAGRHLTARDPTARLALLASDGAASTTVASEQLGRLRRSGVTPTLATVTMGGNDLLAAYGDATAVRNAIQTVADNGRRLLAGLRDLMGPEAPIVVATVYDPSDGSGDHGRLKARLRPMRGLKQDRSVRVVIAEHAFVQNVRRGHDELAAEAPANRRVADAFDEVAAAI